MPGLPERMETELPLFPWTNNQPRPEEPQGFTRPRFKTRPVQANTRMPATELYAPPPDRVEPRVGRGTPADKAPDPDFGHDLIPAERYTSKEFMTLEWERLWTKTWLMACRESDIPQPGDFVPFTIGKETILIVRQWDDSVRAFYNVCRHRGSRIVPLGDVRQTGHTDSFLCPFHNWEWDIDGTLIRVPDPETFRQGLPCESLSLKDVQVASWAGWLYVCLDPNVEPLEDYLEILPDHLDCYRWENLIHARDQTVEWPCNWKTAMDVFSETYHVQATHPQLLAWTEDYHVQIDTYGRHSRSLIPFYLPAARNPDQYSLSDEITNQLNGFGIFPRDYEGRPAIARRQIQKAKRDIQDRIIHLPYRHLNDEQLTDNYQYTIFPNVSVNVFSDYVLLLRMRPHGTDPNRSYCDVQILTYQDPNQPKARAEHSVHRHGEISLGMVIDQDAERLAEAQTGLRSGSFEGYYLGEQERRIRHFHQVLMAYLEDDGSDLDDYAPGSFDEDAYPAASGRGGNRPTPRPETWAEPPRNTKPAGPQGPGPHGPGPHGPGPHGAGAHGPGPEGLGGGYPHPGPLPNPQGPNSQGPNSQGPNPHGQPYPVSSNPGPFNPGGNNSGYPPQGPGRPGPGQPHPGQPDSGQPHPGQRDHGQRDPGRSETGPSGPGHPDNDQWRPAPQGPGGWQPAPPPPPHSNPHHSGGYPDRGPHGDRPQGQVPPPAPVPRPVPGPFQGPAPEDRQNRSSNQGGDFTDLQGNYTEPFGPNGRDR